MLFPTWFPKGDSVIIYNCVVFRDVLDTDVYLNLTSFIFNISLSSVLQLQEVQSGSGSVGV